MQNHSHAAWKPQRMIFLFLITIFLTCMILVYCWILLTFALAWWNAGKVLGRLMAVGISIMPLLGIWAIIRIFYNGFGIQYLSQLAQQMGADLTDTDLGKRPSGRIILEEADELFSRIKTEWEADPDAWISNYRLAKAYDYAGDRPRARKMMNRALKLEKNTRKLSSAN